MDTLQDIKYAALFGGSGNQKNTSEYIDTIRIGRILAELGFVVKNGGYGGMMEAVSKGVVQVGGKTIGITCKEVGSVKGNSFLTDTIVTERLYERLPLLIENTSIFIVQKGGIGTLSEVFLTLDILRKDEECKEPKLFFIGAFWNDILNPIKTTLLPYKEHQLFKIFTDIIDFENYLKNIMN